MLITSGPSNRVTVTRDWDHFFLRSGRISDPNEAGGRACAIGVEPDPECQYHCGKTSSCQEGAVSKPLAYYRKDEQERTKRNFFGFDLLPHSSVSFRPLRNKIA